MIPKIYTDEVLCSENFYLATPVNKITLCVEKYRSVNRNHVPDLTANTRLLTFKYAVMARVFTTRFVFNQRSYDAIVTIISREEQLNFTVKLMDAELLQLLPDGHINYTGKDGFREIQAANNHTQTLIQCIATSVEKHLTIQP